MPNTPVTLTKRMMRWMIVFAVVTPMLVTGLNVLYTNSVDSSARARSAHARELADMRWCRLFTLIIANPNPQAQKTEAGRAQLKEFVNLYNSLGCVKK
jgi:hypothetical protein